MTWFPVSLTAELNAPPSPDWFPRPLGQVSGYAFEGQGTQHLNYRGYQHPHDNSIYELWWDGQWHWQNLTLNTVAQDGSGRPAPAAAGDPHGYAFEAQSTQHINYRGEDNHIYELWWDGQWHWQDLTLSAVAQDGSGRPAPAAAGDPHGYAFEAQSTQHINYRDQGNNIIELYWDGQWHWQNLTQNSGAALAAGAPHGYAFEAQGTQHINYRDQGNHIIELYWDGQWHWSNLTQNSAQNSGGVLAPAAVGDPHGYAFESQGSQHINYRGEGDSIIELWWDGQWHWQNLTLNAGGAPVSVGDPHSYAFEALGTQHVYYQAEGGDIYQLCWDGGWHFSDLTQATGGPPPGEPATRMTFQTAYPFNTQGTRHVIYTLNELTVTPIYELYWTPEPLTWIRFEIRTGNTDAGGGLHGSDQTADVLLSDGSSFTVTLRHRSEPNWDNWTTHTVDLPIPNTVALSEVHGIAGVRINLVQDNPDWSADNWDIFSLAVYLFNPPFSSENAVSQLNLVGSSQLQDTSTGLVRLSKSAGPSGSGPSSPVFKATLGPHCS